MDLGARAAFIREVKGDRASARLLAVVENSDGSPLPNVQVRWW
jgi:hypothetical protein